MGVLGERGERKEVKRRRCVGKERRGEEDREDGEERECPLKYISSLDTVQYECVSCNWISDIDATNFILQRFCNRNVAKQNLLQITV